MSYTGGTFLEQANINFTNANIDLSTTYNSSNMNITEVSLEDYSVPASTIIFTDTALGGGSNVRADTTLTTTNVAIGQVVSFVTGTGDVLNNNLVRVVIGVSANSIFFNQPLPAVTDGNVLTVHSVTEIELGLVHTGKVLWLKNIVTGMSLVLNKEVVLPLNGFWLAEMNYTSLSLYNTTTNAVTVETLLGGV